MYTYIYTHIHIYTYWVRKKFVFLCNIFQKNLNEFLANLIYTGCIHML